MKNHPALTLLQHAVAAQALTDLRDCNSGTVEFRNALRIVANALTYEATRDLPVEQVEVQTPVGRAWGNRIAAQVTAIPILRAGVGMLEGFLEVIPDAATGYIALRRDESTLQPREFYRNIPDTAGRHIYLLDPMLATGGSLTAALRGIDAGEPAAVTILAVVAAPEGVKAITAEFPGLRIFAAALDERLNERGYIVPGLGDAGDRLCSTW